MRTLEKVNLSDLINNYPIDLHSGTFPLLVICGLELARFTTYGFQVACHVYPR